MPTKLVLFSQCKTKYIYFFDYRFRFLHRVLDRICGQHHPCGTRRVRHGRTKGAFRAFLDGAGSLQRSDGEYRQRAGHKYLLHAERRAAGGDGRYKGADAGRIGLPRQEVPHRESEAESRVQGDALRQRAIIRLTNH